MDEGEEIHQNNQQRAGKKLIFLLENMGRDLNFLAVLKQHLSQHAAQNYNYLSSTAKKP